MSLGNFSESGNQESAKEVKFAEVTFLSCNLALCGTDIEIAKFNENLKSAVKVLQQIQQDVITALDKLKDDPKIAKVFRDSKSVCESKDPLIKIIERFGMMLSKFEIIINFLSSTTLNLNYVFQFKDALLNEVYNAKDFHKKASEDKKLLCLPLFKAIGMENPEAYYGFNPDGYLLQNILDEVTSISFSFEM